MATLSPAVELTRRLVRADTINPPGNESRCVALLAPQLQSAGFDVIEHPYGDNRASLVARLGAGRHARPPLAFTGHLDTVPLGARRWSRDPFGAEIDGDRLYGRGSSDMKSGVAAFVAACVNRHEQLSHGPGVVLVITAAEETGCEGARALATEHGALGKAGALVIAEPTANYPLIGHKGALWLRAVAEGVTAHGSMPDKGVNAVMKAARAAVRLDDFDFNEKRHAVLGAPTLNVGTFHGGLNINSVPDRAEIGLDLRTIPGQSHAALKTGIAAAMGQEVTLESTMDVGAIWTDPEHPWIAKVFSIARDILGEMPSPRGATYFTDGALLQPALGDVPAIVLGPGEPHLAHQTDEYCLVSRIDQAVAMYERIIDDWCRG